MTLKRYKIYQSFGRLLPPSACHVKITRSLFVVVCRFENVLKMFLTRARRIPEDRIPKFATRWTPSERRKRGRPKTTWRRKSQKRQVLYGRQSADQSTDEFAFFCSFEKKKKRDIKWTTQSLFTLIYDKQTAKSSRTQT